MKSKPRTLCICLHPASKILSVCRWFVRDGPEKASSWWSDLSIKGRPQAGGVTVATVQGRTLSSPCSRSSCANEIAPWITKQFLHKPWSNDTTIIYNVCRVSSYIGFLGMSHEVVQIWWKNQSTIVSNPFNNRHGFGLRWSRWFECSKESADFNCDLWVWLSDRLGYMANGAC